MAAEPEPVQAEIVTTPREQTSNHLNACWPSWGELGRVAYDVRGAKGISPHVPGQAWITLGNEGAITRRSVMSRERRPTAGITVTSPVDSAAKSSLSYGRPERPTSITYRTWARAVNK